MGGSMRAAIDTEALANLVADLQNQGYIYQEIGDDLAVRILKLLEKMSYTP